MLAYHHPPNLNLVDVNLPVVAFFFVQLYLCIFSNFDLTTLACRFCNLNSSLAQVKLLCTNRLDYQSSTRNTYLATTLAKVGLVTALKLSPVGRG